ncbi:MAG: hypothetical protein JWR22_598 [Herminiimonas sp.]|nr:hypothetical protein [Herminiimonas sp.]
MFGRSNRNASKGERVANRLHPQPLNRTSVSRARTPTPLPLHSSYDGIADDTVDVLRDMAICVLCASPSRCFLSQECNQERNTSHRNPLSISLKQTQGELLRQLSRPTSSFGNEPPIPAFQPWRVGPTQLGYRPVRGVGDWHVVSRPSGSPFHHVGLKSALVFLVPRIQEVGAYCYLRKLRMSDVQRDTVGTVIALLLIALAAFVVQRFFVPLIWASVLCIASWPLYERLLSYLSGRSVLASILATTITACLFLVPILFGLSQAMREVPALAAFVMEANDHGLAPPLLLQHIPVVGSVIHDWWLTTLGQPRGVAHLFSQESSVHFSSSRNILRELGSQLFRRLVDFGFAFLCLFFFYKDGRAFSRQIARVGAQCVGPERWSRYATNIPNAIRGTVNGLVLIGIGEGVAIGLVYGVVGLPSPALWGAATGVLAIIPFGAPIAYLSAAAILASTGSTGAGIAIAIWGTVVVVTADHVVRPTVIGNATRLPFLAVLFGILGGVETLGLLGLFIGPVVMVLVVTLWREADMEPGSPGISLRQDKSAP